MQNFPPPLREQLKKNSAAVGPIRDTGIKKRLDFTYFWAGDGSVKPHLKSVHRPSKDVLGKPQIDGTEAK